MGMKIHNLQFVLVSVYHTAIKMLWRDNSEYVVKRRVMLTRLENMGMKR